MKKIKMFAALIAMVLTTGVIFACSKDDEKKGNEDTLTYPKTLTSQGVEIKEFHIYVGSAEGGKSIDTKNIAPEKYWKRLMQIKNSYADKTYTFINDSEMKFTDETETYKYKFEAGKFYVLDKDSQEWSKERWGNIQKLYAKFGFCYYIVKGGEPSEDIDNDNYETLESVLNEAGISSLSDLKSPTDTIMWCNVDYIWK